MAEKDLNDMTDAELREELDKLGDAPSVGLIGDYHRWVERRCALLERLNRDYDKLSKSPLGGGLSGILDGLGQYIERGVACALEKSPLRELAEDFLSETIGRFSRDLTQNLTGLIPEKLTNTLADVRRLLLNTIFSALTFQNDFVLFFAYKIAESCLEAIAEKREVLLQIEEAIRKLNNAIMVLIAGGPFYADYLKELREALVLLELAHRDLTYTQSVFFNNDFFSATRYKTAQERLDQAFSKIVPLSSEEDIDPLISDGVLKGLFDKPSLERRLSQLTSVPKMAYEMLGQYDFYSLSTAKVNSLILSFQTIIGNMQKISYGKNRELIIDHLSTARGSLRDIVNSMTLAIYGKEINPLEAGELIVTINDQGHLSGIDKATGKRYTFKSSPLATSSRSMEWAIRVKSLNAFLDVLDPDSLAHPTLSNTALSAYNRALSELSKKDDWVTNRAILRATDGRELVGDMEGDFTALAFQSIQAVFDSNLSTDSAKTDHRHITALSSKVLTRVQMSIQRDYEIEDILRRFMVATEPLHQSFKRLGDSIYSLLENLGMDRALDLLKKGKLDDFFNLTGDTVTYVGAALSALSYLRDNLGTLEQQQCITTAMQRARSDQVTKVISAQRAVTYSFPRLKRRNERKCERHQKEAVAIEACSHGVDLKKLLGSPSTSLQSLFSGVLGGEVFNTVKGAGTNWRNAQKKLEGNLAATDKKSATGSSGDSKDYSKKVADQAEKALKETADAALRSVADPIGQVKESALNVKNQIDSSLSSLQSSIKSISFGSLIPGGFNFPEVDLGKLKNIDLSSLVPSVDLEDLEDKAMEYLKSAEQHARNLAEDAFENMDC